MRANTEDEGGRPISIPVMGRIAAGTPIEAIQSRSHTIQVPPDGKPILLLNDCQTIGGYPKIAHVITVDLGAAARLRPDDVVQFREVKLEEAHALLLEREQDFERFRLGLNLRFS